MAIYDTNKFKFLLFITLAETGFDNKYFHVFFLLIYGVHNYLVWLILHPLASKNAWLNACWFNDDTNAVFKESTPTHI